MLVPNLKVLRNIVFREEMQLKSYQSIPQLFRRVQTLAHGYLLNSCSHICSKAPDLLYLESLMNLGTRFFLCCLFLYKITYYLISFSRSLVLCLQHGISVKWSWPHLELVCDICPGVRANCGPQLQGIPCWQQTVIELLVLRASVTHAGAVPWKPPATDHSAAQLLTWSERKTETGGPPRSSPTSIVELFTFSYIRKSWL